jgi:hypothetical protein
MPPGGRVALGESGEEQCAAAETIGRERRALLKGLAAVNVYLEVAT